MGMVKPQKRQKLLLQCLENRGTGVINISNSELSALMGCSVATVKRDLEKLDGDKLIIRETNLVYPNGTTKRQRDIILKDQTQRRFTLNQHRLLSDKNNHFIFQNQFTGEVIWKRNFGNGWERCCQGHEFKSKGQALSWMYWATSTHWKKAMQGDRYSNTRL